MLMTKITRPRLLIRALGIAFNHRPEIRAGYVSAKARKIASRHARRAFPLTSEALDKGDPRVVRALRAALTEYYHTKG